jgi:hypothetical protein
MYYRSYRLNRLICHTVKNRPLPVNMNASAAAANCPKVASEADQTTMAVSARPQHMSNSMAAIQYSRRSLLRLLREIDMFIFLPLSVKTRCEDDLK